MPTQQFCRKNIETCSAPVSKTFVAIHASAASSVALEHCVLNSLLMHCVSKEILGEDIASFVKANLFFVNWLLTEVKRQLQSP